MPSLHCFLDQWLSIIIHNPTIEFMFSDVKIGHLYGNIIPFYCYIWHVISHNKAWLSHVLPTIIHEEFTCSNFHIKAYLSIANYLIIFISNLLYFWEEYIIFLLQKKIFYTQTSLIAHFVLPYSLNISMVFKIFVCIVN